jgi:hypothetical protein
MLEKRKRITSTGEINMFSGLLYCADCGASMSYHSVSKAGTAYYQCSRFRAYKNSICSSSHCVRKDVVEQAVIAALQDHIAKARDYETSLRRKIIIENRKNSEQERITAEIKKLKTRDTELSAIIRKLYEKSLLEGTDDLFTEMSTGFRDEQKSARDSIDKLSILYEQYNDHEEQERKFYKLMKKYDKIDKLTTDILHETIDRIEVCQCENPGKRKDRKQEIRIHFIFDSLI